MIDTQIADDRMVRTGARRILAEEYEQGQTDLHGGNPVFPEIRTAGHEPRIGAPALLQWRPEPRHERSSWKLVRRQKRAGPRRTRSKSNCAVRAVRRRSGRTYGIPSVRGRQTKGYDA
jgi:hypothetical protein